MSLSQRRRVPDTACPIGQVMGILRSVLEQLQAAATPVTYTLSYRGQPVAINQDPIGSAKSGSLSFAESEGRSIVLGRGAGGTHSKARRAALYLKPGADGHTAEEQQSVFGAIAAARGWTVVAVYEDSELSGAECDAAPGLGRLLRGAKMGRFDVAIAWSVERLSRSLPELFGTLSSLEDAGVDLYFCHQAIDTAEPAGRMFLRILKAFSELEKTMIGSRVTAGISRARARGVRLGRPRMAEDVERAIKQQLDVGVAPSKVAEGMGVSVSTVRRIKAQIMAR